MDRVPGRPREDRRCFRRSAARVPPDLENVDRARRARGAVRALGACDRRRRGDRPWSRARRRRRCRDRRAGVRCRSRARTLGRAGGGGDERRHRDRLYGRLGRRSGGRQPLERRQPLDLAVSRFTCRPRQLPYGRFRRRYPGAALAPGAARCREPHRGDDRRRPGVRGRQWRHGHRRRPGRRQRRLDSGARRDVADLPRRVRRPRVGGSAR